MGTLKFRLSLAQVLVEKHGSAVPCPVYSCQSLEPPTKRLRERHFLEHIPATGKKAKPQRCTVCSKHGKRKESIYWCSECEAGLCLDGWFKNSIQLSPSNSLASIAEIQNVHVIRLDYRTIF
jgi:hypothetical protein